MRPFTTSLLLAFLVAACTPPGTQVRLAEQTRFRATVARDTAALRAGLHPDLLYIHSNGLEESARDFVASVASGRIRYERFEPLQPVRIQPFGKTALADGAVRVHGRYEGTPFSVDLRYTSTYVRQGAQWRLVRWQSLKVE